MRYLLDSNAVIAALNDADGPLSRRLRSQQPREVGISVVVMHELYFGAFRSQRREANLSRVDALRFEVLPLDVEDARHAGEIRALLADQGTPIGAYDVLIAGQARARNLVLVTRNLREFDRVPSLVTENWQIP
ncbi:MAG: type II toxin-antitoxin system VapC family toxin [Nevskia sp.]|nr:type II toxin-antitoxin system VapC family toxin [Nevskia sp.]